MKKNKKTYLTAGGKQLAVMGSNWQWCNLFCSALTIRQPAVQCPHHQHRKSCHLPEETLALAIPHKHQKSNHIYQNIYIRYQYIKPKSSTALCFSSISHFVTEGLTAMSVLKASWPFPERFKYRYLQSAVIQLSNWSNCQAPESNCF